MTRRADPASEVRRRVHARVTGTVQGVGFRPYVFRLATSLGLGGYILNDERGVLLEVEGAPERVEEFVARLPREAPPLASVEDIATAHSAATGEREFRIVDSERHGEPDALVSPDAATCPGCLAELLDPRDRRYRYPFINCTNCGPRFTIVRGVPYDRALTTMASFEMCSRCLAEYEDPLDRRFHAQPNACPDCGPAVRLLDSAGREVPHEDEHRDPIEAAAARLRSGAIVAIKGLGGFHLACRADDETAVAALRSRKHREDRPFALMATALEGARELVELSSREEALLHGRERPIVIARRRPGARVAHGVAPHSRDLGVMLPYSPLHHLLLADAATTLVMTSGNVSDEPIAYRDDDALRRLAGIADATLIGARPIHMRTDDSVLRSLSPLASPGPIVMRRSRGYVPRSVDLPLDARRPVLGCGAELKSTFCLARGKRAWVGHHIGDLKNYETFASFQEAVEHFERLFSVSPEVVAHDLHPDYLSTRFALEREGPELVGVQHHHAHLAACLAEHGVPGPAAGAIYDGSGYGADGTAWGGELLAGDLGGYRRAGHLLSVGLPGGDAAVREPWRMACAWVAAAFGTDSPSMPSALRREVDPRDWEAVSRMLASGTSSPKTSSIGRLFDAVAAMCGIRARVNYEGQAAAELEGACDPRERGVYPMPLVDSAPRDGSPAGGFVIDARETIQAIAGDLERGEPTGRIASRFHGAVATATAAACQRVARRLGTDLVVLSGGVFQNRVLLEHTMELLVAGGLRGLFPLHLPPNDGGIAYGQVAVACAGLAAAS